MLFPSVAFASPERIKELEYEAQDLMNKRQLYISEAQKIEIRLYEISGAIKELTPKEVKKEKK